jgi:hypothetical protein
MQRLPAPKVWIDDEHPIFRRGLVTCLHADGFDVVGESARFTPEPAQTSWSSPQRTVGWLGRSATSRITAPGSSPW